MNPRLVAGEAGAGGEAATPQGPPLRHLDGWLVLAAALLLAIGWLTLRGGAEGNPDLLRVARQQLLWAAVGAALIALVQFVDYTRFLVVVPVLYAANIAMLVGVLVFGTTIKGARSWFDLGPFNFQPSETMKVLVALALAQWFALRPEGVASVRDLVPPGLIVGVPMVLVFFQPDLGTMLVFGALFFGMLYWAGAPRKYLVGMVAGVALAGAVAFPFMKPYQRERILVFVDPSRDPRGSGYNVLQARIAIGAGGLTGVGWKQGTQSTMRFLPEHHTDFAFSSMAEQFGLVGIAATLGLFGLMLARFLRAVEDGRDRYGSLAVAGVGTVLFTHAGFNIGMNLGLLPVSGLPLPLFSYGGSFMVTTCLILGIAINVGSRRYWFSREGA